MTLMKRVRGLIGNTAIYECRHCGTTLESDLDECPICGHGDIVSYELG